MGIDSRNSVKEKGPGKVDYVPQKNQGACNHKKNVLLNKAINDSLINALLGTTHADKLYRISGK